MSLIRETKFSAFELLECVIGYAILIYLNFCYHEFKEVMYETYVDTIRHNEKLIFDGFHNYRFKQVVMSYHS